MHIAAAPRGCVAPLSCVDTNKRCSAQQKRRQLAPMQSIPTMSALRNGPLPSVFVAVLVALAILASSSAVGGAGTPALPIVVNTWPFVNATRVAYRVLTQEADASAIDAVEKVRKAASCQHSPPLLAPNPTFDLPLPPPPPHPHPPPIILIHLYPFRAAASVSVSAAMAA
jgi:hypothetical protein